MVGWHPKSVKKRESMITINLVHIVIVIVEAKTSASINNLCPFRSLRRVRSPLSKVKETKCEVVDLRLDTRFFNTVSKYRYGWGEGKAQNRLVVKEGGVQLPEQGFKKPVRIYLIHLLCQGDSCVTESCVLLSL